ncbi:putative F-box domain-containing protein [Colletotrichum sublineola]|uniref:Putative F-box domain-containing protein n=1 Tax=Colletotrichum sublineola TaxID=1173701 RepID=A0A066WXH5_COLSU|nr:putative F-box domain-containing protein [Colletotrichum sublineola]
MASVVPSEALPALNSMPTEILDLIFAHISPINLWHLRLISKRFNAVLHPHLLSTSRASFSGPQELPLMGPQSTSGQLREQVRRRICRRGRVHEDVYPAQPLQQPCSAVGQWPSRSAHEVGQTAALRSVPTGTGPLGPRRHFPGQTSRTPVCVADEKTTVAQPRVQ